MERYSSDTIKTALGWLFFETILTRGLSLLVRLYLVRLLLPNAFGLIGMASVFIAFLTIMGEMGMAAALVQRKTTRMTEQHWHTAFTVSFLISALGWFLIFIALAPLAAVFYGEPELNLILPALGFSLITDSLAIVQRAKLTKELRFKALSIASIAGVVPSSALGIFLAYYGFGVWALVVKTLSNSILTLLILWTFVGWIPKFYFSKEAFKDLFGFSAYVFLERLLIFFMHNIDYLLIGKLVGTAALGIYTLAFTLTDTLRMQIMNTFNKVFFPVYSNLQDDKTKAAAYFLKVIQYTSLIINPLMLLMLLDAQGIVTNCFGGPWRHAWRPLQILAVGTMVHTFGGTASTLIRGAGHARLVMVINFVGTVFIAIPAISLGAVWGGINGAALGVVVHRIIGRAISLFYIFRLFPILWIDIIRALLPSTYTCVTVGILNLLLRQLLENSLFGLLFRISAETLAIAVLLIMLLPGLRATISRTVGRILDKKKKPYSLHIASTRRP